VWEFNLRSLEFASLICLKWFTCRGLQLDSSRVEAFGIEKWHIEDEQGIASSVFKEQDTCVDRADEKTCALTELHELHKLKT